MSEEPTNRENALRIDYLEERVGKHSKECVDRNEVQENRFDQKFHEFEVKLEKIMDTVTHFAQKYMEKLHIVELAALKDDRATNIKIAKITVGLSLVTSVAMGVVMIALKRLWL